MCRREFVRVVCQRQKWQCSKYVWMHKTLLLLLASRYSYSMIINCAVSVSRSVDDHLSAIANTNTINRTAINRLVMHTRRWCDTIINKNKKKRKIKIKKFDARRRSRYVARHKRWRDNKNELLDHKIDQFRTRNRRPTDWESTESKKADSKQKNCQENNETETTKQNEKWIKKIKWNIPMDWTTSMDL